MTRRRFLTAAAAVSTAGAAPPRCGLGLVIHSFGIRKPENALRFLEYGHSLGAGGIQMRLGMETPAAGKALRDRAGEWGMYLEGMCGLPKTEDTSAFERTVRDAREAGALCLRTACLSGRRYETFGSLADWKDFVRDSKAAIARAVPIVEKHKLPLAIENHKDWTFEEQLQLLKEYESRYVGVTLDTGNNISLLDDPVEHTRALAPYAVSTHLKDMGVEEYSEGFLLAEVPFGAGMLNMAHLAGIIREARPETKMSLEMITRNPLRIPCLTEKYWQTFPDRNGRHLAHMLALVRKHQRDTPLPRLDTMGRAGKLRFEEDNVKQCLNYARERMGL